MSNDPLKRLRKRKRPAEKRIPIAMDTAFQDRIEEARAALSKVQMQANLHNRNRKDANPDLADELQEAEDNLAAALEAAEAVTEWFVAKALAPRQYDDLINKYPPTKEQKAEARKANFQLQANGDTFPPALIAECVYLITKTGQVDPDTGKEIEEHTLLTDEFVKEMYEGGEDAQWNQGETNALFQAAMEANQRGPQRAVGLGNG